MKECCDVLCHNYVDLASIYRILPQIWPDPNRIQIQIRTGSRYIGVTKYHAHILLLTVSGYELFDIPRSGSDPDPPNSPDIELDPVHLYLGLA